MPNFLRVSENREKLIVRAFLDARKIRRHINYQMKN